MSQSKKYRHKLIIVEAKQWFPDHPVAGVLFPVPDGVAPFKLGPTKGLFRGAFVVDPGDWIVYEANGMRALYSPAEFAECFEPVQPRNEEAIGPCRMDKESQ